MGWALANVAPLSKGQRAAVTVASVIPDLDGLGLAADFLTRNMERPTNWYAQWHHVAGHNLVFALLTAVLCSLVSPSSFRGRAGMLGFLSFHLHILGDLCGSRGPDGGQWDIVYLWPFSAALSLRVPWQWELNAWPNLLITVLLLAAMFWLAWKRGFSVVELFSSAGDRAFVKTLRHRFGAPASSG
jgi:inner membrane protein